MLSVGQFLRDVEFPFAANGHQLQRLCPALYHLIATERRRVGVAFVAAVEDGSIDKLAFILHNGFVGGLRFLARSGYQHFVLQSAGQCYHAFFLGIVGQPLYVRVLISCHNSFFHFLATILEELLRSRIGVDAVVFLQGGNKAPIEEFGRNGVFRTL